MPKAYRNKLYYVQRNYYSRPGKESSEQYSTLKEGCEQCPFTPVRLEKLLIHERIWQRTRRIMSKCLGIITLYRILLWMCLLHQKSKTERIKLFSSNVTITQKKKNSRKFIRYAKIPTLNNVKFTMSGIQLKIIRHVKSRKREPIIRRRINESKLPQN